MNKQIMISIRPEHAVNILNGKKTLELRKSVPKDFIGWVNVYVSKAGKRRFRVMHQVFFSDYLFKTQKGDYKCDCNFELWNDKNIENPKERELNGKVVARFWFDETYYIKQAVNVYGDELNQISIYDNKSYGWKAPKEQQEILKQLCLTEQEVLDYVKGKGANAWNIKQLEMFDKPLELKNFYKLSVGKVESAYIQLDKAPQSWRYVYYAN